MGIKLLKEDWSSAENNAVRLSLMGYMYYKNSLIDNADKLARIITEGCSSGNLENTVNEFNGVFALIINCNDACYLVSDNIRSLPLFYLKQENDWVITDDLNMFLQGDSILLDEKRVNEYAAAGFVSGNSTVFKDVYCLQAAEIVTLKKGYKKSTRYNTFTIKEKTKAYNIDEFVSCFNAEMDGAIYRMLQSAPDVNNWVLPLSGGHDSRHIINTLYKAGVKNVICYTYGTPNNPQARVSRQVAEALGYEWHFIEYTEEKWGQLHENGMLDKYIDISFQGISTPHLQDFLAVYELKQLGVLKQGDVIVPGHTLDFISGGHFHEADMACTTKSESLKRTVTRHARMKDFNKEMAEALGALYDEAAIKPSQFQEYINWQERQAKFIVNSCRVYEFFGFRFRLPFWDKQFVSFWLAIPVEDRLRRNLLLKAERQGIFIEKLAAIPFEDEIKPKPKKKTMSQKIKDLIPASIRTSFMKVTGKKVKLAEGLNQIYSRKGKTVLDIIGPETKYPAAMRALIKPWLSRYPYQANYHFLSSLYALKRTYDKQKQ